jgi:outer membrane lipoprotein-sorting protein
VTTVAARRTPLLVAAVLALVAGLVLAGAQVARSQSALPEVTAAELLASVTERGEDDLTISGDLAATVELGLPDVGGFEGLASDDAEGLSALTGDRRLRIAKSPDGVRLAELGDSSERAFVTDGETAWTWDSSTLTATRYQVPAEARDRAESDPAARMADPLALAEDALAAVDDTTDVAVTGTGRVAGRDTYQLVLTPRTDATLVGRVVLDIDGEERVPLRAAVYARGAEAPSIEAGFTSVSFGAIDPVTFTFTPPPGTTVEEGDAPAGRDLEDVDRRAFAERARERAGEAREGADGRGRTIGEGWDRVVAFPVDVAALTDRAAQEGGDAAGLAGQVQGLLPFSGPLFSAAQVEVDGESWLLVGAVPQAGLQAAAEQL